MNLPTYKEFEQMCKEHDFLYFHTDDHSVYVKHHEVAKKLHHCIKYGDKEYLNIMIKAMEEQGA